MPSATIHLQLLTYILCSALLEAAARWQEPTPPSCTQHKQPFQPSGFYQLLWLQPLRVYGKGTVQLYPHLWAKSLPCGHQKHLFFWGLPLLTFKYFGWWSVLSSSWKKVKVLNDKLPATRRLFLVVTYSLTGAKRQRSQEADKPNSPPMWNTPSSLRFSTTCSMARVMGMGPGEVG